MSADVLSDTADKDVVLMGGVQRCGEPGNGIVQKVISMYPESIMMPDAGWRITMAMAMGMAAMTTLMLGASACSAAAHRFLVRSSMMETPGKAAIAACASPTFIGLIVSTVMDSACARMIGTCTHVALMRTS